MVFGLAFGWRWGWNWGCVWVVERNRGVLTVGLGLKLWVWDLLTVGLGFARCGLVFFIIYFYFFLVVGFAHSHALQWWWCRQWVVVGVCVHSGCWVCGVGWFQV